MPTEQTPKQLIVERIKNASNILVTVGYDPSVDELSAALGLTMMINKLDKTATAVFSGAIPPAIEFLEPSKTFEADVDGLRDFIIALDKEKADRLRYKVEDDVVRVFITPYKTTITEADLSFSQGDFNVDLIVALGVEKKEDLDAAVTAHGRILHDATTVTINIEPGQNSLGEIDWNDPNASSLCEMLMSLSEALQSGLLDQQIATAILTGIVSATDRFSNTKTSPKVMTMAAQLMAAGANQQLIADRLEEAETVSTGKLNSEHTDETVAEATSEETVPPKVDGEMLVNHDDDQENVEQPASEPPQTSAESPQAPVEDFATIASEEPSPLASQPPTVLPPPENRMISHSKASSWRDSPVPVMGGTLNATTGQAEEDNRIEAEKDQNRMILSHDNAIDAVEPNEITPPAINGFSLTNENSTVRDIFADSSAQTPSSDAFPTLAPSGDPTSTSSGMSFEETSLPVVTPPPVNQTLADLEAEVHRRVEQSEAEALGHVDNARAEVDEAFSSSPFDPAGQPLESVGAQPLGEISHDHAPAQVDQGVPVPLPPSLPPLPDFSTLPPLPGEITSPAQDNPVPNFGLPEQPTTPPASPSNGDPGQFSLPGQ